jgi:hypothetical protein
MAGIRRREFITLLGGAPRNARRELNTQRSAVLEQACICAG